MFSVKVPIKPVPKPDTNKLAWEKFGFRLQPITEKMMRTMRLPTRRGLIVTSISDNGPARRSGIILGDIVYSVGRHHVADMDELGILLEHIKPNQRVLVGIIRTDGPVIYKASTAITAAKSPIGE